MSQLAITQSWMEEVLLALISKFEDEELTVHLYKNDYQPTDASVLANFTECDFSGYDGGHDCSIWSAGGIVWAPPRMVLPGPTTIWPVITAGTTNTVYGYFVKNSSNVVRWAQRAEDPEDFGGIAGDACRVTLQYSVRSEFHSTT